MSRSKSIVKKSREEADLTQEALALKSGVARSHIAGLESGQKLLTHDVAVKIAGAVGEDGLQLYLSDVLGQARTNLQSGAASKSMLLKAAAKLADVGEGVEDQAAKETISGAVEELIDIAGGMASGSVDLFDEDDGDDPMEAGDDRDFWGNRPTSVLGGGGRKGLSDEDLEADDTGRGLYGDDLGYDLDDDELESDDDGRDFFGSRSGADLAL